MLVTAPAQDDRPVLALDVDGVIALEREPTVPVHEARVSAWGRWTRTVVVPEEASSLVARLAQHAEIVWVSAWGHNAHTALAEVLDLPEQPWTFLPVQFDKAAAVAEYAGSRRWMLVDDGVGENADPPPGGLVRHVDPARGIADLDADEVVASLRAP